MNVFEAMNTRISVPALTGSRTYRCPMGDFLRAGARAPDHGRLRPWRFLIVRGAARELLGEVMAEAWRASKSDGAFRVTRPRTAQTLAAACSTGRGRRPGPAFGRARNRADPGGRRCGPEHSPRRPRPGTWRDLANGAPAYNVDVARALACRRRAASSPSSILEPPNPRLLRAPTPRRRAP